MSNIDLVLLEQNIESQEKYWKKQCDLYGVDYVESRVILAAKAYLKEQQIKILLSKKLDSNPEKTYTGEDLNSFAKDIDTFTSYNGEIEH